jgi:hypothetical protein
MFGSALRTAATASWWSRIASNELPSTVSVFPEIEPLSSVGMKPLGTAMKSRTVPARMAAENASAVGRRSITHTRLRS